MYTETLIEILLFALCLSIYINSIHLAFGEGMILEWLYKLLDKLFTNKTLRKWIGKPLYLCPTCMASLHSLPLLTILVWWKVFFIAIFAVVISTLINDKLFE